MDADALMKAHPIYEITVNGQVQQIAFTIGSNGFIVGANPR
jgi:filamentous hemagglutinin